MPIMDMPLEALQQYKGTNPRPADFDAYWERALAEMHATDAEVEMVPADFQTSYAECFELTFTGVKGARIHTKLLRPKTAAPGPALLKFHGYSGSSGDWFDKLPYVAAGWTVAALDCRGQGGLSQDAGGVVGNTLHGHIIRGLEPNGSCDNMLMRNIFLDTAQLAGIVMDLPGVDENRVCAFGGSQGGGLSLACAALEPRVARVASAFPFLSDYRRVWDLDLDQRVYEEIRTYLRLFDPLHRQVDAFFEKLGYIDVHLLAPRIRARVFMAITLMDEICPPSTQFAAYNCLDGEKEAAIYPDYGHEMLPLFEDMAYRFLTAGWAE